MKRSEYEMAEKIYVKGYTVKSFAKMLNIPYTTMKKYVRDEMRPSPKREKLINDYLK